MKMSIISFFVFKLVHTNSILTTFCSILYYKDLNEYIHRYRAERRMLTIKASESQKYDLAMYKFGRRLSELDDSEKHIEFGMTYNKIILNRWHLYVMMSKYPGLIQYRMKYKKKSEHKSKPKLIEKVKLFCKKHNNVNKI